MPSLPERRTVHFSGEVQGVGFRMTAERLARQTAVRGEVRNLPDGRVELIAEGTPQEIGLLVHRLQEHFGSGIHETSCLTSSATGDYSGFSITG